MTAAVHDVRFLHADEPRRTHRHGWWWKALLAGALLWGGTIGVTVLTRNVNLVPTLILIGSFLVPFAVVLFVMERLNPAFPTSRLMIAFFVGGVLGVLGASLLEAPLGSAGFAGLLVVGFAEELVKGLVLAATGRALLPKTARQGALLGTVVGAGFAAFESAGYAFNAAIGAGGIDLPSLLGTEATRAALTPLGHVLWTGLLGAALFGASRDGRRYRATAGVLGIYVAVALLHGLWDGMSGISVLIAIVLAGGGAAPAFTTDVLPAAAAAHVAGVASGVDAVGLGAVSVAGGLLLGAALRRHRGRDRRLSGSVSDRPAPPSAGPRRPPAPPRAG